MKTLWELFAAFFRIGAFTFGGGYAMLSLIQKEVVENKKWATDEEVLDYYAVAQCTPGVIAVNTATFIGYKQKGVLGAVAATFGVVLPSLIIISIIAAVLQNFMQYEIVQHIFGGIRVAVAVLIVNAVITMGKKAIIDRLCVILSISAFLVSVIFPSVSPVFIVLAAALTGIVTMKRGGADK
ncbi:MAG: chromate transporter [Ruminococcaceae bacterium]|nr:chromate transporter [Oscillospiraceae bacterium]